jgi:hypothetical protein
MNTHAAGAATARSAPLSWLFWLGNAVSVASRWCFRKVCPEKQTLSRAQEKQRRKALVRELQNRK